MWSTGRLPATRNAGARQAHGDIFFFVDADTLVNAAAIQSAVRSIRAGAVGGGCVPRFEGWLPWWFRLTEPLIGPAVRLARFLPSGAFLFCTRGAFQTAGGLNERYTAAEEVVFVAALKRQGRVVILPETVGYFRAQGARAFFLEPGRVVRAFGFSRFPWASEPSRIGVLV